MKLLANLFKGRINRSSFAVGFLIYTVVGTTFLMFAALEYPGKQFVLFEILLLFLSAVFAISLYIKRLHDSGHSGWWTLVVFIPMGSFVLLGYALIKEGTRGENSYGPAPKPGIQIINK